MPPLPATPSERPARRRLADLLIRGREALLAPLLWGERRAVLNPRGGAAAPRESGPLVIELAKVAERFRAAAFAPAREAVDYQALSESPAFEAYRHQHTPRLRSLDLAILGGWAEQQAFWINLYNLLVLDAVISFGVRHSVTEGFVGIVRFFRRAAYQIGGERSSLEDIEHGILRANRGHPFLPGAHFASTDPRLAHVVRPFDPRIHFALNCASRSCPPIRFYTPDALDSQLDMATRNFLANEVQLLPDRNELRLSRLFQWYQGDFGGRDGLIQFLSHHHPEAETRQRLAEQGQRPRLVYLPYDWGLNG